MSTPDVRQRRKDADDTMPEAKDKVEKVSAAARAKAEDSAFSLTDVARTIVLLLLASSALSYFVTRESFTWGVRRPSWATVGGIKSLITGPQALTDADLKAFDGSDPTKPIYLAINGTIYDVTAGGRHYGPGGSYHFFAGKDASRAFITNCFEEDGHPDIRGAEEMFIPLDDREIDALYTSGELKALKEQERRQAKVEAYNALKHWVDFFGNNPKYPKIGRVKREAGWENKGPVKKLCKRAQEGRKLRKRPVGK
ncbi:related to DNA damage response protein [Rhynchosporium agropyri]|uniref:Related to DNA damage response protein n=1 Tax=Rhynchosporium agropyri TaxID=914238 RepID=A0A1E1KSZ8_9HELO|nr:related to DNA damage response protein [Rhynchosporium agropyri]